MNKNETTMLFLLRTLRQSFGGAYVRAEFEAEGLGLEELLRLKEVSVRAGFPLVMKIGGCEGLRDLLETKIIGTDSIVAPMIESGFALRKYSQALRKAYGSEDSDTLFWFNLETKTAHKNLASIVGEPAFETMAGAVIERVDLCFSLGLSADDVDTPAVGTLVEEMARAVKAKDKKVVIGGGVSARSTSSLIALRDQGLLDYAETRKIGFDLSTPGLDQESLRKGILHAVAFEILFLENQNRFRSGLDGRDRDRAGYLRKTYGKAIETLAPELRWEDTTS